MEQDYVTIATRIKSKVNKVIQDLNTLTKLVKENPGNQGNLETGNDTAKYKPPVCFYCLDESHKVSVCLIRKFCIDCGTNLRQV